MSTDTNAKELLHGLGYVYSRHGQTKRALVMQLIAARITPNDPGVLRTLAHTFMLDGAPDRAIAIIQRLEAMDGADDPALQLLKSRVLWAAGRQAESREAFRLYRERRQAAEEWGTEE
jgi:type III secretion protein Y